jgi:hypothetical protein
VLNATRVLPGSGVRHVQSLGLLGFTETLHLMLSEAREFARRIAAPSRLYTLISTTSGPTDGVHLTPDCKRTDHYGRKIQ